MMNEETKASLNKFLKEREERIKNMTLAEARDTVSRIYGHSDMRMESDKALQMLLDCADEVLEHRWIPVSERLPEPNVAVLTYINTGATETYCLAYWNDRCEAWEEWIGIDLIEKDKGYKVMAWRELPEPY